MWGNIMMFGHDDQKDDSQTNGVTPDVEVNEALLAPENFNPDVGSDETSSGEPVSLEPTVIEPANEALEVTPAAATSTPVSDDDDSTEPAADNTTSTPTSDSADPLLGIKQDALQSLSPLLGHLDQTAEEKFRTTMMLIQATDNKDLIKDAYTAAKDISDEKTRAQALLDVVNEINYFTQAK